MCCVCGRTTNEPDGQYLGNQYSWKTGKTRFVIAARSAIHAARAATEVQVTWIPDRVRDDSQAFRNPHLESCGVCGVFIELTRSLNA